MQKNSHSKYSLVRLGREVFPTRPVWDLQTLQAQGLPLYWNRDWLAEGLRSAGSVRRLAEEWGYPWGEVARFARRFGLSTPEHRPWRSTFVMLEEDLLKEVDQHRKGKGVSRNRWIVTALKEYLEEAEHEEEAAQEQPAAKAAGRLAN